MTRTAPESSSSQRARILGRLIAAHGAEVPLSEISSLAAQYNSRIWSLRKLGFKIVNRTEEIGGVRRSWFRLIPAGPVQTPPAAEHDTPNVKSDPREQFQLFPTKEDLR
jgi:hypothetical protein